MLAGTKKHKKQTNWILSCWGLLFFNWSCPDNPNVKRRQSLLANPRREQVLWRESWHWSSFDRWRCYLRWNRNGCLFAFFTRQSSPCQLSLSVNKQTDKMVNRLFITLHKSCYDSKLFFSSFGEALINAKRMSAVVNFRKTWKLFDSAIRRPICHNLHEKGKLA